MTNSTFSVLSLRSPIHLYHKLFPVFASRDPDRKSAVQVGEARFYFEMAAPRVVELEPTLREAGGEHSGSIFD